MYEYVCPVTVLLRQKFVFFEAVLSIPEIGDKHPS